MKSVIKFVFDQSNWQIFNQTLKQVMIGLCLVIVLFSSSVFVSNLPAIAANKSKLEVISDRIDQLQTYIDANNWITVKTYIHGPLGQVRQDIAAATRLLKDPTKAKSLSTKFFNDLISIDVAADRRDFDQAFDAYEQARKDFDQLVAVLKKF
ncbi:Oxygen evolving enhancer protein 3 (PsbQ) [Synechococcus sp. PCC 7502]|uniref:photosystem II protein PsbQ n=1 Tax=Synechococcus sp. PCC 7502 TaxID=1173263 RepID=UPI00029F9BCD|nr:Oxygen evolving enhancer protein 3 (PsbQ) [Synechococcus sp. PCC 7502]AFY74884.1 Oxygen evolving enhancer protein 3 (PsbQ) [Synechococcus sp. PCC 7502]